MFKIVSLISLLVLVGCTIKSHHKFEKFFKNSDQIPSEYEEVIEESDDVNVHFGPGPEMEKKSRWNW